MAFNRRCTHEGPERRCGHCAEWWPEDGEFFNRAGPGWQSWCKACKLERRADTGKARRAAVDQAADVAANHRAIQAIIHAGIAADAAAASAA